MTIDIIVKYIHFLGIFSVVSSLVYELLEVKNTLSRAKVNFLSKIDGLYGLGSIMVLLTGFTMWFAIGKPAEFYGNNWIFYTKIGLFTLVGLASIYPTVFFAKNRKGHQEDQIRVPLTIIYLIRLEVFLLLIIPLLATLMAKGVGNA